MFTRVSEFDMNKSTYIFDFDGTLANTLPLCFDCFRKVFKKFNGINMTDLEIQKQFGPSEEVIIKRNLKSKIDTVKAIELFYTLYEQQHDYFVNKNMISQVFFLLNNLKQNQKDLGMVTGKGYRSLEISLAKLGFKDYFDVIITDDDVINHKPDSEGLLKALKVLNSSPENAVFLGDSSADIGAGKKANVTTVGVQWFNINAFELKPDFLSNSPNDFIIGS